MPRHIPDDRNAAKALRVNMHYFRSENSLLRVYLTRETSEGNLRVFRLKGHPVTCYIP